MANDTLPRELSELAGQIGYLIQHWGFKAIHGRIWTLLYLSPTPLDTSTMIERLDVSKALMSISLRDLLAHQVILEEGRNERGAMTYSANPNVVDVILGVLKNRECRMLDDVDLRWKMLLAIKTQNETHIDRPRLKSLGNLIHQAQDSLSLIIGLATVDLRPWRRFTQSPSPAQTPNPQT